MLRAYRFLVLSLLTVWMSGCATSSVTNLTPSRLPAQDDGMYSFSVEWASRQRALIDESIKAYVVIGSNKYEMRRTPMLPERWETLVPVPENEDLVNYRYRFDYDYKGIPTTRSTTMESNPYTLIILDPR